MLKITLGELDGEVLQESRPVLVAFIHQGPEFEEQYSVMKDLAETVGDGIKLCAVEDCSLSVFMETFSVKGTPTFILFKAGREVGRLLGQMRSYDLKKFIFEKNKIYNYKVDQLTSDEAKLLDRPDQVR